MKTVLLEDMTVIYVGSMIAIKPSLDFKTLEVWYTGGQKVIRNYQDPAICQMDYAKLCEAMDRKNRDKK